MRNADATLIIASPPLTGGTKLTTEYWYALANPDCARPRALPLYETAGAIMIWLDCIEGHVLNVAGPRASEDSEIYGLAYKVLHEPLSKLAKAKSFTE